MQSQLPPPPPPPVCVGVKRPVATGAFVCGVTGAVLGLIPILFLAAWILGIIALVLGVIAWRQRKRLARAATILGVCAVALGFVGIAIVDGVLNDADEYFECVDNSQSFDQMDACDE